MTKICILNDSEALDVLSSLDRKIVIVDRVDSQNTPVVTVKDLEL